MARKTSFYYAFLILPPAKRRAIVAVWDFCRAVDDAVDESSSGGSEAIGFWKAELARCYDECDSEPQTGEGRRLQPFIKRFGLPREGFDDVIAGVAMDLERTL
jgi:phytoene synthase